METKNPSTVDQFFNDLPGEEKVAADIFDDKKAENIPEKGKSEGKDDDQDDSEPRKNRRHRRLEAALQQERESNIELAARLKERSEAEKFARETGGEVDPRIAKMFDSSDVGKENALALSSVLRDMTAKAREEALDEFENRQEKVRNEQREYETFIDNELTFLEEEYNVDLTSDSPAARKARREFIELVQDLSPKDKDGELTGFADFDKTFEIYQKTKTESKANPTSERRREIASSSMQRSGTSNGGASTPKAPTPGFRGWMKDFNIR
jgi:hypothetical protein